jgi:tetratricopeptide (TPR) repeat protein
MPVDLHKIDAFIKAVEDAYQASEQVDAYNCLKRAEKSRQETEQRELEAQAVSLWEEFQTKHPQDYITAHHLAISYHSQAWDLEQQGKAKEAAPLWKKALTCWALVWRTDAFWKELTDKMVELATEQKGFNAYLSQFQNLKDNLPPELQSEEVAREKWDEGLAYWHQRQEVPPWWEPFKNIRIPLGGVDLEKFREVRQGLPEALLEIHFTLALYYNAADRLSEAHSHFDLIIQSDLPQEIKQKFRNRLYQKFEEFEDSKTSDRPFRPLDRDEIKRSRRFQAGINLANRLLEIDPENVCGLEFLLMAYHEWNGGLRLQKTLGALAELEGNMQTIGSGRYVDKINRALREPGIPSYISHWARDTVDNLEWPIIHLSEALMNDYSEIVGNQRMINTTSDHEKQVVRRLFNNLLKYGQGKLNSERLRNIKEVLNSI